MLATKKSLVLAASPVDQSGLRLDEEARDLKEQLRLVEAPSVEVLIEHRWAVRSDQIQAEMLNTSPQILHFSGHGDSGKLIFEDRNGVAFPVSGAAIAGLIEACGSVECVLLNSCYSQSVAVLVAPHVKAVIGCDDSIADEAAIAFTRSFYRALAHGRTYERAFVLAKNEVEIAGLDAEAAKYHLLVN